MKKLVIIFATISSAAFAQQKEIDKNRNDKLSPKEEKAIQNKIEKPVIAEDKKTKVVEKTFEVKSGTATETTTKPVVKEKIVLKKKRKKVVKK